MRIGFDVAQTCVERAGCAWHADSLARALAKLVLPPDELFLYHHFGDWLNSSTERGTRVESRSVKMPLRRLSAKEAKAVWSDPANRCLGRPDIVHATSYRAPRITGARLVYTIFDVAFWTVPQFTTDENRVACLAGTLEALAHADGFVFISHSARDEFERVLPGWINEHHVPTAVIHLGPRQIGRGPLAHIPHTVKGDERFWLVVGTAEPRKNYEAILSALPAYRKRSDSPAPVVFAGGGGWKSDALKAELARQQEAGSVRLLGYVDDSELAALYQNARGLLFPSWYEGFGLPVLEALSHGCPVVSSDRTSLREVGGDVVRYIDPARPESIVEAMLAIEKDPDIESAREAALAQAAKFSWGKAARETMNFYREVLSSERRVRNCDPI